MAVKNDQKLDKKIFYLILKPKILWLGISCTYWYLFWGQEKWRNLFQKDPMKNVLMLFFRSKKTNNKKIPSFFTPNLCSKPTLIILTFFPSEWARGKMTIGNQWRKLHAIVNNICIYDFLYLFCMTFSIEKCWTLRSGGRESEMSSMAAAVYASPRQFSHTRFIFFTPKVPDPQQFDYCCCYFHSSSTGHGNSIQIGRFSPLIPFE